MNGSRKQKTGSEKGWPGSLGNAGLRIGLGMEGRRTGTRWFESGKPVGFVYLRWETIGGHEPGSDVHSLEVIRL